MELPEAMRAGDSSNLEKDPSLGLLIPGAFSLNYISFAKSDINFLCDELARSTLWFFLKYHFQKISFYFKLFGCITEC